MRASAAVARGALARYRVLAGGDLLGVDDAGVAYFGAVPASDGSMISPPPSGPEGLAFCPPDGKARAFHCNAADIYGIFN